MSHGRFCEELKVAQRWLWDHKNPSIRLHSYQKKDQKTLLAKFEATVQGLEDYIVFADLLGGTPCNTVSRLILEGRAIDLYAGMNLPMVIEFINSSLTGNEGDYPERAKESIVKVNDLLSNLDDDEDE